MSKILTEYFRPGRAIALVALLLVAAMGLQIYLIPQVLRLKIEGEMLEGSTVGVILIFSYTLTTLSFLFLVTEYFNMKNRVKTYVKLTGLQTNTVEEKQIESVEAMEPIRVKPAKKGLFSWLSKKAKPEVFAPEKKLAPRAGLFGRLRGGGGKDSKPKPPNHKGEKKPLLGFLSRKGKKRVDDDFVASTKKDGVNAPKTIRVELASLPPIEKTTPLMVADKTPEVNVQKVPDILAQAALKESGSGLGDKPMTPAADVLKAINELPKMPPPPAATPTGPAKASGLTDLLDGVDEPKPTFNTKPLEAPTPMITAATGEKPQPSEKVADGPSMEVATQKYKTVGLKIPSSDSPTKPSAPTPTATPSTRTEATKFTPEDSEFIKVLTDLRTVVDELKTKRSPKK